MSFQQYFRNVMSALSSPNHIQWYKYKIIIPSPGTAMEGIPDQPLVLEPLTPGLPLWCFTYWPTVMLWISQSNIVILHCWL